LGIFSYQAFPEHYNIISPEYQPDNLQKNKESCKAGSLPAEGRFGAPGTTAEQSFTSCVGAHPREGFTL
jgi:hypothetical protein